MRRSWVIALAAACLLLGGAGTATALNEECAACHGPRVADLAASSHAGLACEACHEGAANHGGNMTAKTTVHFDLEVCAGCHPDQYATYVYGDSVKTKYGGSPYLSSKLNDFANYNDIIDGQGFVKEYNEEQGHDVMLQAHYDIKRGKFETCLQCKSTKVAYYWDAKDPSTGAPKELTVENDTYVKGGHMAAGVTVPKGTKVTMATNRLGTYPKNHEVQVLVTLPNGTMYSSFDYAGATKDFTWTWSALYALTVNELAGGSKTVLSGNGCNHCHNPHKVGREPGTAGLNGFRLIRSSLKYQIAEKGMNPTVAGSTRNPNLEDGPLTMDGAIALCGQCHVEYVCGKSSVDNIDRDFFPWAKVSELEGIYQTNFLYNQDWKHGSPPLPSPVPSPLPSPIPLSSPWRAYNGISYTADASPIQENLIKSQHPEAETYWGSRHYGNDAPCFICHMPKVTKIADGAIFTSHWFASPLKYMTPAAAGAFAQAVGVRVDKDGIIAPCGACHGGTLPRMKTKAENIQDSTYASALQVQAALVASLKSIKAAKDGGGNPTLIADAVADHRSAHVRWENLVVSENSMGFHNYAEVSTELKSALAFAQSAKSKADSAYVAPLTITTTSPLPGARLGRAYSTTLAATGGLPPCTWAVIGGGPPPGLNLAASTGTISGTPTARGAFTFTAEVTDSRGAKASKVFSLQVR